MATRGLNVSKDQSREFMACFPDIVRELTETGKHTDVPEASKWLAKVRPQGRISLLYDSAIISVTLLKIQFHGIRHV